MIQEQVRTLAASRAFYFKKVRHFFDRLGCLEVDPPLLSRFASVDAYIDLFQVEDSQYLHTSPEYAMKRLLAKGCGNIYFLGHVFRKGEVGCRHNPEFTLVEWYMIESDEKTFLQEALSFLALFLGEQSMEVVSYQKAYQTFAKSIETVDLSSWEEEEKRHYVWATFVEPHLGMGKITVVTDFPAEDAALAKTAIVDGVEVAKRYEFYFQGVELGNGFCELLDAVEQKKRLIEANRKRVSMGKKELPLDHFFLEALEEGLPQNTYGVAMGFDRLFMLASKKTKLEEVIPFPNHLI